MIMNYWNSRTFQFQDPLPSYSKTYRALFSFEDILGPEKWKTFQGLLAILCRYCWTWKANERIFVTLNFWHTHASFLAPVTNCLKRKSFRYFYSLLEWHTCMSKTFQVDLSKLKTLTQSCINWIAEEDTCMSAQVSTFWATWASYPYLLPLPNFYCCSIPLSCVQLPLYSFIATGFLTLNPAVGFWSIKSPSHYP